MILPELFSKVMPEFLPAVLVNGSISKEERQNFISTLRIIEDNRPPVFYISKALIALLSLTDLPDNFKIELPYETFHMYFQFGHRYIARDEFLEYTRGDKKCPVDNFDCRVCPRMLKCYKEDHISDYEVIIHRPAGDPMVYGIQIDCAHKTLSPQVQVGEFPLSVGALPLKKHYLIDTIRKALFYIGSKDADVVFSEQSDAYRKAIEKLKKAGHSPKKHKKAAKLKSQIDRMKNTIKVGYNVTVINQHEKPKRSLSEADEKREVKPHWRRGHFRNQWFGSGDNKQQKIIWLAPVGVNFPKFPEAKRYFVV